MENYIGKVCPYCKAEIKEGEGIKVCPACGIPHHIGCWEENKGCTTFGCSEQHYEVQGTNPTDVCQNCGATLSYGQMFCPKCGIPKDEANNVCSKCGSELQNGQEFCPKCGQKIGVAIEKNINNAILKYNSNINKNKSKSFRVIPYSILGLLSILLLFIQDFFYYSDYSNIAYVWTPRNGSYCYLIECLSLGKMPLIIFIASIICFVIISWIEFFKKNHIKFVNIICISISLFIIILTSIASSAKFERTKQLYSFIFKYKFNEFGVIFYLEIGLLTILLILSIVYEKRNSALKNNV